MELTYCNPLTIANVDDGRPLDGSLSGDYSITDYRSISDPSVIYHDGKWIMYPSYHLAYVTEDFVHWHHVDIGIHDVRYSPAVVVNDTGIAEGTIFCAIRIPAFVRIQRLAIGVIGDHKGVAIGRFHAGSSFVEYRHNSKTKGC